MRFACALLVLLFSASFTFGQQPAARARITQAIDENRLVTLPGNTPPLARSEFDQGAAPDDLQTHRMMLLLSRAPEQQTALDAFLEQQQTPGSPNFRHWLTPMEFGQTFGAADADVQTITSWLQQQGFAVERVAAGKSVIEFSGSAGQVRQAFHTALHQYELNGKRHFSNVQDPQIPAALAPVVRGLVSLNNFPRKPLSHQIGPFQRDPNGVVVPKFTVSNGTTNYYALGPADFGVIYNTTPLLQAGNNGAGQTIAIIGHSNVNLQDITAFRNLFGLGAGNTSVIVDGTDPGIGSDEGESVLDLEWASAVAPGAAVVLVTAQDTETTSGLDLAIRHVIENNLAGVVSLSYGNCEAQLGTAGNQYVESLWKQAAAQGITVTVSSGDSGSAGCDNPDTKDVAVSGVGVNGFASTPYNVAVGGTDFNDAGTQTSYWNATNSSTTLASAKSYIPEMTWNETCAATAVAGSLNICPAMPTTGTPPAGLQLWASSGGASSCIASTSSGGATSCQNGYPKPSWQTGSGVPSDGVRDIPDVALFSAANSNSNSFYVVCQADALPGGQASCQPSGGSVYFVGAGGTSAAAPSFAAIVALAEQKAGARLGNINYVLYSLAAGSGASCASSLSRGSGCIFNDVVKGNNSVPCHAGSPNCSQTSGSATGVIVNASHSPAYAAGSGYDLATGLGSVNAASFVPALANAVNGYKSTSTALTLNGAATAITAQHGASINVGVSVTPNASSGSVSLIGTSGGIDSNTLTAGQASWASKLFPGGTYNVKAHYAGDGTYGSSDSNAVPVTINPESSQTFVNLVSFDAKGTILSLTGNSVPYGSPYILRVDVADTAGTVSAPQGVNSKCSTGNASCPTGKITLTANGAALDAGTFALNAKGFAEDQAIQLSGGTYSVAAAYSGDSSYTASMGTSAITITKAPTSLTAGTGFLGPYRYGTAVPISAQLTTSSNGAGPTGTLTFLDNGVDASASIKQLFPSSHPGSATGSAGLTYSAYYIPPSLGTHTLTAQYPGDGNYAGASATSFSITVTQAVMSVSSYSVSPNPATPTLPVTLSMAFISSSQIGIPSGTMTFSDNGTPISGTVQYATSTGYIKATLTTTFSQVGTHALSVTYSGDTYTLPVTTQQLPALMVYSQLPTTLQAQSSLSMVPTNYPTNLSAEVGIPNSNNLPTPTGTIVFSENGQQLSGTVSYSSPVIGYGTSTLVATLPYTFTSSGTHSITASYSGDSTYAAASAPALSLSAVDKVPTTIPYLNVYITAANQRTSLSASINSVLINTGPSMAGTVEFLDGGTPMPGTVTYTNYQGYLVAVLPYSFTTSGTHNITVQYSGDTYYAASQSQVFAEDILGPLALRFSGGGNTVTMPSTGGTGSVYLQVSNTTANAMSVALTCTSDSAKATCSFNPSTINLAANTTNGPTMTFTVPAVTASLRHHSPFAMPFIFAGLMAGVSVTTRKRRALFVGSVLVLLVIAMASCGGGGTGGSAAPIGGGIGSSPATYHFTITATSGSYTDSQVLTVTVP